MRKKMSLAAILATLAVSPAHADALDELLASLKQKGVITEADYARIAAARETEKKAAAPAPAPAAAPAPDTVTGRFKDGIVFETADKENSIALKGTMQLDYRRFGGDDRIESDTYDMRRAVIAAKGKFWKYYSFDVSGDLAKSENNRSLNTAYLNVGWWRQAEFRFGQFDKPFTLENMQSSRLLDFAERAWANTLFVSPDRGVMVHGEIVPGANYWLASTNGRGENTNITSQSKDGKETTARGTVNFARFLGQKDAVYHLGLGHTTATLAGNTEIGRFRTEARSDQFRFMNIAAFNAGEVRRRRSGLELALAKGPVKLQAEAVRASYAGTTAGSVGFDKDIRASYVNLMWMVTGEHYADSYGDGEFGRLRPRANFDPKGGGWGAWEIGLRFSRIDAGDFKTTDPAGSGVLAPTGVNTQVTNGARSTTLGLKWIVNPNTRFLVNFVRTRFDSDVTTNGVQLRTHDAIVTRAQIDF